MADKIDNSARLEGNDIVFDCEHCGNGLVVDIKGAGLKMQCPECKEQIYVPIPKGVELADIDSHLVESPGDGENEITDKAAIGDYDGYDDQVTTLLTELEELRFRTQFLEKKRIEYHAAVQKLSSQIDSMRTSLKEMDDILGNLVEKNAEDTQELG